MLYILYIIYKYIIFKYVLRVCKSYFTVSFKSSTEVEPPK